MPPPLEESAELCAELLEMFRKNDIRVIRLGLHSGGNVDSGYIAGVYHPAFGEICENVIFRKKAENILSYSPKGFYRIEVNPRDISKMTGQKKSNIKYFGEKGYFLTVSGNSDVPQGEIRAVSERN